MSIDVKQFRKQPVTIEAVQFRPGNADNDEAVVHFLEGCTGWHMSDEADGIVIPTLEGDHLCRPGDWIIRGVAGEFYPCKPEIFEATYESAAEGFPVTLSQAQLNGLNALALELPEAVWRDAVKPILDAVPRPEKGDGE